MTEVRDNDLKDFCDWYKEHFGKTHTYVSSLSISLAGHLHITVKMAEPLVWEG